MGSTMLCDDNGVITIDCHDDAAEMAAAYLIIDGDEAAFIENNTPKAVPYLLAALHAAGGTPEMVKYLIVTHAHLDHVGGTAGLLAACANAVVAAHPSAATHLMHPLMLIMSTRAVLGAETFERRFGGTQAVAADRIVTMQDGDDLRIGNRVLRFIHTPGHTAHHCCVYDQERSSIFTGDAFGAAFPFLGRAGKRLLFPLTPPTDFDLTATLDSLDRIAATGASRAYLTHFGPWDDLEDGRTQLEQDLLVCGAIVERLQNRSRDGKALGEECYRELRDHYSGLLRRQHKTLSSAEWHVLDEEIRVNAQGFAQMVERRARSVGESKMALRG
jgi:glyoxylase-like metal-dependent hydrolase (beta-lactamase superfamily II)